MMDVANTRKEKHMAFWAEEVKDSILKRKDKKYLITDYKTPSGKIHIGALRGVVVHDVIYQSLKNADVNTEYWYGYDDFDPMDGLSKELEGSFKQYMGMPLCNIPSPDGKAKNYAEYFAQEFISIYNSLGIKPKTIWASELYKTGVYNDAIKIILDNAPRIREIYKEVSGSEKPKSWFAFQVVCPKCGKIGTTRVYDWDGKEVSFVCEENLVNWAKGCGYKGKISPYNGNGKMPYKVETPSKWFMFGTSVELAGKDHYTKGGTFDVAKNIAREIFKINPAYGFGYEHFLCGGKKMSSSKGIGASISQISKILPAEILKFLMVRNRPQRAIEFDPQGDTIPRLFDEFDRCIEAYQADKNSDLGQAYFYSKLSDQLAKYRLRFIKAAYLLQMPRVDIQKYAEEENGKKLNIIELEELETRKKYAKMWLESYAPEESKFEIQESLPKTARNLNTKQKEFLAQLIEAIQEKNITGEDLHGQIHEIKKSLNIDPREAFSAIYLSLLGKESGPQAGWLIASLDKDFVINRFKSVIK